MPVPIQDEPLESMEVEEVQEVDENLAEMENGEVRDTGEVENDE